jgi:hypothetical protein
MNQGPRYVRLMEKSRGQKSRATVPLMLAHLTVKRQSTVQSGSFPALSKLCQSRGRLPSGMAQYRGLATEGRQMYNKPSTPHHPALIPMYE